MVESLSRHISAPRVLTLLLGLLALALAPAVARGACVPEGPHASPHRHRALGLGRAVEPPPRPTLSAGAAHALPAAIRGDGFRSRCSIGRRAHVERRAHMAAGLSRAAATAAADVAAARGLPPAQQATPPEVLPVPSPRRSHVLIDRRGRGGGRSRRRLRRDYASASSSGGPTAQVSVDGYQYSWALGYQNYAESKHVTGYWVLQQNGQPYIDDSQGTSLSHSLGQLWAISRRGSSCMSDVETGWTVSKGQYGDLQPHLFIYAWDCGVGLGYVGQSSIPWVQYSSVVAPNQALSADSALHVYGVDLYQGNWWFYYDGQWVGYIPGSAWTRYFPSTIKEGEAGGEVATPEYETCTAMGNDGLYGTNSRAALVGNVWYQQGRSKSTASLSSYTNDTRYTTGDWRQGSSFRYGGPGWCD